MLCKLATLATVLSKWKAAPFLGLSQTRPDCPALQPPNAFVLSIISASMVNAHVVVGFFFPNFPTSYLQYSLLGSALVFMQCRTGLGFGELSKQKKLWRSRLCWHCASRQHAAASKAPITHSIKAESSSPPPIDKPRHVTFYLHRFSSSLRCFHQSRPYSVACISHILFLRRLHSLTWTADPFCRPSKNT